MASMRLKVVHGKKIVFGRSSKANEILHFFPRNLSWAFMYLTFNDDFFFPLVAWKKFGSCCCSLLWLYLMEGCGTWKMEVQKILWKGDEVNLKGMVEFNLQIGFHFPFSWKWAVLGKQTLSLLIFAFEGIKSYKWWKKWFIKF